MILRRQCDNEGSEFSDHSEGFSIYVCAERVDDDKIKLYEQIEDVEKEGAHYFNRQIIVDRKFIEELNKKL